MNLIGLVEKPRAPIHGYESIIRGSSCPAWEHTDNSLASRVIFRIRIRNFMTK